jgi:hypothetical protein
MVNMVMNSIIHNTYRLRVLAMTVSVFARDMCVLSTMFVTVGRVDTLVVVVTVAFTIVTVGDLVRLWTLECRASRIICARGLTVAYGCKNKMCCI